METARLRIKKKVKKARKSSRGAAVITAGAAITGNQTYGSRGSRFRCGGRRRTADSLYAGAKPDSHKETRMGEADAGPAELRDQRRKLPKYIEKSDSYSEERKK